MTAWSAGVAANPAFDPRAPPLMNHPLARFALTILGGAALGAALGYFGQCTSGACPLTSTWWRGALFGGFIGLVAALSGCTH